MDVLITGILACLAMDMFQILLRFLLGQPPSNWAVVGRWTVCVARTGRIFQPDIENVLEIPYERPFGWFVHYAVGTVYALIYAVLMHTGLLTAGLVDGLIFGMASVVVPWFFFLPVMGKGVMGRHTPAPVRTCGLAFANHCVFGLGMAVGFQLVA